MMKKQGDADVCMCRLHYPMGKVPLRRDFFAARADAVHIPLLGKPITPLYGENLYDDCIEY